MSRAGNRILPAMEQDKPSNALADYGNTVGKRENILVRVWKGYENGLGAAVAAVSRANGRLGSFIAHRPWTVLLVSLFSSLVICVGWVRFREATDTDVLWVPQSGKARDDQAFVEAHYPRSREGASFYAQLKPEWHAAYGGDNALQIPVTWEMFQLHSKIMALTVDDASTPSGKATFMDLCYRGIDGKCQLDDGFLWYWLKDFNLFLQNVQGSPTDPAVGDYAAFKTRVSSPVYPDGQPVSLLSVFGGTAFSFNPFTLQAAQVIASDYTLNEAVAEKVAEKWHTAFTELMKEELPKLRYMTATWITGSTAGEELGKAIGNDMFLIIISLLVYIVVGVAVLSKWDRVRTRAALALAGILVTGLGLMSGWGWGMIFGMPFTPLQQLSPFILLGMGIDVVFVLQKSYDIIIERQPWLTLPEAFSRLMSTAGLSVQVTLLASTVAFALGSVDDLNSVKWFSAFSALNTLMIMVLMMTMFVACMVLTEKRIAANRLDFLCCIVAARPPLPAATSPMPGAVTELSSSIPTKAPDAHPGPHGVPPMITSAVAVTLPPLQALPPVESDKMGAGRASSDSAGSSEGGRVRSAHMLHDDDLHDENLVKKFFRKIFAPVLQRWYVKVVVLLLFTAWGAASWYGIYQMRYGQPLSDLAPDGSYLQDYDRVQTATYYQQVGEPVGLYFRGIDPSLPDTQYRMLASMSKVLDSPMFNASTSAFLGNWLISFTLWAQAQGATVAQPANNCFNPYVGRVKGNLAGVITPPPITGCVPQPQFYPLLRQWLAGSPSSSLIIDERGRILTNRLSIMQSAKGDDDKYESDLMEEVRRLEKAINHEYWGGTKSAGGTYTAFIYGGSYVFNEGTQMLPHQMMLFFILALVGVFVVTTFMLVNPVASVVLAAGVGLVGLYLFGELWALKIRFNQVSVINLIMATGLSVDYTVYTAQKFMTVAADGTGNGRMQVALADTGSAVFLGGMTALLGSVPMAFSKSVIIRTFFRLIFGTILFSLLVGLVLLPVVLSILAPPPVRSALADGVGGGSTATPHQAAAGGLRTGQEPRRVEGERGEGDGGNLKDAAEEGGAGAVVGAPAV